MAALGASQARVPRAAVDGIDLVCPQVHTKVHMRDLPPPRETRSAAALIGVRDIGHRKSEPVIASTSLSPQQRDRPESRRLVQLYKAKESLRADN
ncbi:hypothetical protein J3F84DRAFT_344061 [Trichoderma pleuroticola]